MTMLAGWVSALATFSAVCVALWLARKDRTSHLVLYVCETQAYGNGFHELYISATLTNLGPRSATFVSIPGVSCRSIGLSLHWNGEIAADIDDAFFAPPVGPVTLVDGAQQIYRYKLEPMLNSLAIEMNRWDWRLRCRTLSFRVNSTNGAHAKTRLSPILRKKLEEKVLKLRYQ